MTSRRNERRLEVRLASDSRQFDRGFDKARRSTQSFDQQMDTASRGGVGRFNSSMDVAGQRLRGFIGIAAAAVAGGALLRWAGQVRESANALTESVNAVEVVFGEASQTILDFGETAADSAGLANSEFNQLVVPIGSMLRNFGFEADEAADATVTLAQRAADMASVFNVDVSEALGAIQAALRGESDPIERFGASISAARVQTFLLNEGLVGSAGAITDADKVMGRYMLILKDTERVAGDFANTADSDANATRIFQSRLEDLRAEIGQKMIPIFEELVGTGNDLLPVLGDLGENVLPVLVDGFTNFIAGLTAIVEGIAGLPDSVKIASGALLGLLGTARLLYAHPVIAGLGFVASGIAAIGDAAREEKQQVKELDEAIHTLLAIGDEQPVIDAIRQDVEGLLRDVEEGTPIWEAFFSGTAEGGFSAEQARKGLEDLGVSIETATAFIRGEAAAVEEVEQALLRAADASEAAGQAGGGTSEAALFVDLLRQQRDRYEERTEAVEEAREQERLLADEGEFHDKVTQQRIRSENELADAVNSVLDPSEEQIKLMAEARARTDELDTAVGELADSYSQQLFNALSGHIDLTKEAMEVETTSADQLLENIETQIAQVQEFQAGIERLQEEGLGALAEDIAQKGPEALGALRGIVEDLDGEGAAAFELNELLSESDSGIADWATQMGLSMAREKVPLLQQFRDTGGELAQAIAQGFDSAQITLDVSAQASLARRQALDQGIGAGGTGGTQFRQHGGRYRPGALVTGEAGPELQFPDTGGFVATEGFVANIIRGMGGTSGSGGFTWTGNVVVDARGATDPTAVGYAARRAVARELETFERGMPGRRN